MDRRLYEAARTGNTSSLHALLDEDPLILERGSLDSLAETCLHIAALAGSVNFVKEILSFKPELTKRINKDGFSPIHMASANGYVDVVEELLMSNKELSRQKSADGRTAIHFAAITGRVDVLRALINTCPECNADLTYMDESALHIALKNNQVEAFETLFQMLKEINTDEIESLVNDKDHDGNTILHIAVARKQFRIAKQLLDHQRVGKVFQLEVNSTNKSGYTALDMLFHSRRTADDPTDHVIHEMLQQAGAVRSQDTTVALTSTVDSHQHNQQTNFYSYQAGESVNATETMCYYNCDLWMPWKFIVKEVSSFFLWNLWSTFTQEIENSTPEMRNALMVVAVLIATVTYQSVLSPAGGYREFDAKEDPDPAHSNGIAIIASDALMFIAVIFFSSIGFFLSVVIILMLTSQFPLKLLLRLAVLAVTVDFICTILYIAPIEFSTTYVVVMVLFVLVVIHVLYFMSWVLSRCRWAGRRQAQC